MKDGAHTSLCNRVLVALSNLGAKVFLNPIGGGVVGECEFVAHDGPVYLRKGDRIIRHGRWVDFGLHPGSADVVGAVPRVITEADVGKTLAVLIGPEIKTGAGRMRPDQRNWCDQMNSIGAFCREVRSESDAIELAHEAMGITRAPGAPG